MSVARRRKLTFERHREGHREGQREGQRETERDRRGVGG